MVGSGEGRKERGGVSGGERGGKEGVTVYVCTYECTYVLTRVTHCVCRAALSAVPASLTYCPHFLPDTIFV